MTPSNSEQPNPLDMNDTPQTDALVVLPSGYTNHIRFNHELVTLARTLERELAAVTEGNHALAKDNMELREQLAAITAALRQCREALASCRGGVEAIQAADKVLLP